MKAQKMKGSVDIYINRSGICGICKTAEVIV